MRRAKALPDCLCNFALHGSGGSFDLAAGNRQSAANSAQATTKVATGLNACPSYVAAAADRFGGPRDLFLGWKM